MALLDLLKKRHSEYVLSNAITVSETEIESTLKDILVHTPSAFHSQSQRMVLLLGQDHEGFWNHLIDVMKNIVQGEQFEQTKSKLLMFKKGYGTVLFFDDMETIEKLQAQFPMYKANFTKWSLEQNGMLQSNVWVGLTELGLGGSLQHYNELVDAYVKKQYDIPEKWELRAQMPFGKVVEPASAKPAMDLGKRFYIKKS